VAHLDGDQLAGQCGRVVIPFFFCEVAFEHGVRGALAEIRLEHRRQRKSATGPPAADQVSPRRHRPGR
jgi:hypothetical protein